jgi:hypothetical protein
MEERNLFERLVDVSPGMEILLFSKIGVKKFWKRRIPMSAIY